MVHHGPQRMALHVSKIARLEHALQQQDGLADAGGAQLQRFLQEGDGETVREPCQRTGALRGTVAVGIGFHHRKRTTPMPGAGELVVVAKGGKVDQGTGGTHGAGEQGRGGDRMVQPKPMARNAPDRMFRNETDATGARPRGHP